MKNIPYKKILTIIIITIISLVVSLLCHNYINDRNDLNKDPVIVTQDFENYSLEYVSNGDGTCYVKKIINEYNPEILYDLIIPEFAPNGDKVIEIRASLYKTLAPIIITDEDFRRITDVLQSKIDAGETGDFPLYSVKAYYKEAVYPEDLSQDEFKEIENKYPFANCMVDFYICAATNQEEYLDISRILYKYADYDADQLKEDYNHLLEITIKNIEDPIQKKEILLWLKNTLHIYSYGFGIGIKSIQLPQSIKSLPIEIYKSCPNITEIVLPDSINGSTAIDTIESGAFQSLEKLNSITIPSTVQAIESYAFSGCSSLTSIIFNGTKSQWKAIEKGSNWDENTDNYIIYCSDGDIIK